MPLVLQLLLVMIANIQSLVLIPLILFDKWATLIILNDNDNNNLAITIARLCLGTDKLQMTKAKKYFHL